MAGDVNNVCESMAQHAVATLRSADNVTVMLLLIVRDNTQPSYPFIAVSSSNKCNVIDRDRVVGSNDASHASVVTSAASPSAPIIAVPSIDDDDLMRFLQDDENF